jgi:hypothetical protein
MYSLLSHWCTALSRRTAAAEVRCTKLKRDPVRGGNGSDFPSTWTSELMVETHEIANDEKDNESCGEDNTDFFSRGSRQSEEDGSCC